MGTLEMFLAKAFSFWSLLGAFAVARNSGSNLHLQTDGLQNMVLPLATTRLLLNPVQVTWDEYSLFVNGTRVDIFGGEVHPYRMPVQSLHLDIFQKIKALGFSAVSAYFFWGIHEPKAGAGISFEGFRDVQPFLDAAKEAGLYIIARPGPYINAETTGGGFPGWGTHTGGLWRTSNATYVNAYSDYMTAIGEKLAANQISNGGPVILVQLENEYSGFQPPYTEDFAYEDDLKSLMRAAGIAVPFTVNDAWPGSHFTDVDIYGYDSYPNGFDCFAPNDWASDAVDSTEYFWSSHLSISPQSPNLIPEFQGGSLDSWGGAGYELCSQLLGPAFERVFYKNEFAMATTMISFYMLYGGTNWGGIAYPGVYTSYDYGACIAEDRTLREKAYEVKLQAYFRSVSPAFLTSRPQNVGASQGSFTGNEALKTTQSLDVVGNKTGFYIVRQTDASVDDTQKYTLTVPTSIGNLTIPTIGAATLVLNGKDSKIHVVDYTAGSSTILYSTGEILTWVTVDDRDVILVYGNAGELHETAFKFATSTAPQVKVVAGTGKIQTKSLADNSLALQYTTTDQTVIEIGSGILLYILDRANAYEFWMLHPTTTFAHLQKDPILVKGGYLIRSLSTSGSTVALMGDLNTTESATFEVIAPASLHSVSFNGAKLSVSKTAYGTLTAEKVRLSFPAVSLPNLTSLHWKTADSLPEITPQYSDALWTLANHTTTINPNPPNTSVVLYAGEYGYHTGNILWRLHFNASGSEVGFAVNIQGGSAFGHSLWLDENFLGSFVGDPNLELYNGTYAFPTVLKRGSEHILTLLQDHMGNDENWWAAGENFKYPRGILNYLFIGPSASSPVPNLWKVTGNLGGEDYVDTTRGPLNEGGLYAERQGWHLPGFDDASWPSGSPLQGSKAAGVSFYRTTFILDVPSGVDYPMALVITNSTTGTPPPAFRAQLYVNGYQFGKYISNLGPQTSFPVPQGILNYNGKNTLAVSLWSLESSGARLDGLDLKITARAESSMPMVVNQPLTPWTKRVGAY
uniref:Beta-galactosidase n=1 Tax=Mycena chlorophos TaxID=658473 RepID=A0ABQ0LRW9_MYCCL|nr:glycoside hydrolase family 35 protein [Mycena chlorophos]